MADAPDLGSGVRKYVEVQVLSRPIYVSGFSPDSSKPRIFVVNYQWIPEMKQSGIYQQEFREVVWVVIYRIDYKVHDGFGPFYGKTKNPWDTGDNLCYA